MRYQRQLKLLITSEDDGTGKTLFDDGGDIVYTTVSALFAALRNDGSMSIAALGVESVPFGDVVTASAILLETDQELDLVVNGGAEVLKVTPGPSGKGVLYWEGVISSISITNTSPTVAANVLYAVVGI